MGPRAQTPPGGRQGANLVSDVTTAVHGQPSTFCQSVCFTNACCVEASRFTGTIKAHWPARAVQPCVSSCKARKSRCKIFCKEDLPAVHNVVLAFVMVRVVSVCVCRCLLKVWQDTSAPPTRCDASVQVRPTIQGNSGTRCAKQDSFVAIWRHGFVKYDDIGDGLPRFHCGASHD